MLLDELNAQRDAIAALGRRYGARRIRVFGSVARRQETAGTDIDLLVDLPPGYDMFGQRLPLAQQLEQQLGRRIELIPDHQLNRHMREHVLREAVDL